MFTHHPAQEFVSRPGLTCACAGQVWLRVSVADRWQPRLTARSGMNMARCRSRRCRTPSPVEHPVAFGCLSHSVASRPGPQGGPVLEDRQRRGRLLVHSAAF